MADIGMRAERGELAMARWQSRLWNRWIEGVATGGASVRRGFGRCDRRRRRHRAVEWLAERLEARLVPALVNLASVLAQDDVVSTDANTSVTVDVLANDLDPEGTLDPLTLTITTEPTHGYAVVRRTVLSSDDDSSPVGNGLASAIHGVVDTDGQINFLVSGLYDYFFVGVNAITTGDYALFVRLGQSDFSNFDPQVFDARFTGSLPRGAAGLAKGLFRLSGQTPGTPFIAWIDNTVGSGGPDTFLAILGQTTQVVYQPNLHEVDYYGTDSFTYTVQDSAGNVSNEAAVAVTVQSKPIAANDLVHSRESSPVAIDVLANDRALEGILDSSSLLLTAAPKHGTATVEPSSSGVPIVLYRPDADFQGRDVFRYTVRDDSGTVSNEAFVAVNVLTEPPTVIDDAASTDVGTPVAIDVLANDSSPDGTLDPSSLTITSGPTRGTVTLRQTILDANDNESPVGNGFGSALSGAVDANGHIQLAVSGAPDTDFTGLHAKSGDYALFVRLGEFDFANFDPNLFDFKLRGNLKPGKAVTFDLPLLTAGTPFIAWIDNTVGSGTPDTRLGILGPRVVEYVLGPVTASTLVVDDPSDVNDGNFSPGHLSLREAVSLANGNTDSFRYTVRDEEGVPSLPATVTVTIPPTPTTITFDPRLTARRSATLSLTKVGDISEGNSALLVTGLVTIVGPAGTKGVTLSGTGKSGDLRLFEVAAGGELTLENLTLTNWSSDHSGGAIYVERDGTATLTNCTISNGFAAGDGGAIFNNGNLTLTNSTLTRNQARYGGGFMNYGTATLNGSTLSKNSAVDGAGFNSGADTHAGNVFLSDCLFSGNQAEERGGGFFVHGSSATLTDCMLVGNSAREGGAITQFGYLSTVSLSHSTIKGNSAVDGGGIFNAPGNAPEQVGGGDFLSAVILSECVVTGNSAQRGGGLFNLSEATLTDCTITDNRANLGGGLFNDARNPTLGKVHDRLSVRSTSFSNNRAVYAGGGLFNNGTAIIETSAFAQNRARRGAAVFNDLGSTDLSGSTLTKNVSTVGAELFNHLGVLWFQEALVSSSPAPVLMGTAAPPKGLIVNGPDGIRYALLRNHQLLRQLAGCSWKVLDNNALEFKIAPNGDIYWMNHRRELYRSQAGYAGNILGAGLEGFAMDQFGTVYEHSTLIAPDNFARDRSLAAPLLDEPADPVSSPSYCLEPPSAEEVLQAARLSAPMAQNIGIVAEPIVDSLDAPRYFPGVGLAQMHVCQYKVTIYFDANFEALVHNPESPGGIDQTQSVIYLDRNHLHRFVPDQPGMNSLESQAPGVEAISSSSSSSSAAIRSAPNSATSDVFAYDPISDFWVPERYTGGSARSLVSAPDGTIYLWGSDRDGYHSIGIHALPLVLYRLVPGENWEMLLPAFQFAVGADRTLYTLNGNHTLRSLRSDARGGTTLALNVQSFSLATDGTLYALLANHELRTLRPGSTRWTTLATGVQSFSAAPDGTIYALNDRQQLLRLVNRRQWSVLDRGVQSITMTPDGALYELNSRHELKRIMSRGTLSVLARDVLTYATATDGTLYMLDRSHQLKRLTARDHWTMIDVSVQSFAVAPNVFQDLYILNENHQLTLVESGERRQILRENIVALTIEGERGINSVQARDTAGRTWIYTHGSGSVPVLDPVEGDAPDAPIFCQDPPSADEVMRFALLTSNNQYFPAGPEVARFDSTHDISIDLIFSTQPTSPFSNVRLIVDPIVDETEPPRIYPYVGPARLHHCHYRCTITADGPDGPQQWVIFLDHDHLIRAV